MTHPKEFNKSPLVDATIEVRFDAGGNSDILPGLLFSQLRKEFSSIQELPTLQIPLAIRQNDPNLKYQCTHRLGAEDFILNVGPSVVGLGCKIIPDQKKYPGWKPFIEKFEEIINTLIQTELIADFQRIGVRYVNFFEQKDLFKELSVELKTGWEGKGLQKDKQLAFIVKHEEFLSRVQINNNVKAVPLNSVEEKQGQIIDIDTFAEFSGTNMDLVKYAAKAHGYTEDVFFGILSDELKVQLGAKYE